MRRLLATGLASLLLTLPALPAATAATAARAGRAVPAPPFTWQDLAQLRLSCDSFALRDRVARCSNPQSAPARAAAAWVEAAFNHPAASNAAIARLLAGGALPDSLPVALRLLEVRNDRALFRYGAGLAAVRAALADSGRLSPPALADARNDLRLLTALAQVPPQTIVRHGDSRVALTGGWMPVAFGDSLRRYGFDTGANLSTLMRSEATALGLRMLAAGIVVGSSTDRTVTADLAVADRMTIGAMEFRHVVFLVLDDSLLTFGDFKIPGLVGFPVMEQMGEVRLRDTSEVFVPQHGPRRTERNLALEGLTLLTPVHWGGDRLLFRVDTGAGRTQVYERAYRKLAARIDPASLAWTRKMGGAGGIRDLPVRVLGPTELAVGGAVARLDSLDVLTRSIAQSADDDYLDGNLGHDVFDRFDDLVLDFRDMAVVLEGPRRRPDQR